MQTHEKVTNFFWAGPSPPSFGQNPKDQQLFSGRFPLEYPIDSQVVTSSFLNPSYSGMPNQDGSDGSDGGNHATAAQ